MQSFRCSQTSVAGKAELLIAHSSSAVLSQAMDEACEGSDVSAAACLCILLRRVSVSTRFPRHQATLPLLSKMHGPYSRHEINRSRSLIASYENPLHTPLVCLKIGYWYGYSFILFRCIPPYVPGTSCFFHAPFFSQFMKICTV